jgi:hypothetical protein
MAHPLCPLCLKPFQEPGWVWCPQCEKTAFYEKHAFKACVDFHCGRDACENPSTPIPLRPMVTHAGCYRNVLRAGSNRPDLEVVHGAARNPQGKGIGHWQLGNLSRILSDFPEKAGFWFPLEMLRMSAGKQSRIARIMLRGARDAGKTVLATMAAAHSTYKDSRPLENFTYASANTLEPWSELLNCLQPLSEAENFGVVTEPQPSTPGGRYVRAVFIAGSNDHGADWSHGRAVVFYDFPGESIEKSDYLAWGAMMNATDIVAAVLDANDFFDSATEAQTRIGFAVKTLQSPGRASRALVLTKSDICKDVHPCSGEAAHALLVSLCRGKGAAGRGLTAVCGKIPVFFMGTKDLNSASPPQATGLQEFVDWALREAGAGLPLLDGRNGR